MQLLRDNLTLWTSDMDSKFPRRTPSHLAFRSHSPRSMYLDAEKEDAAPAETKAEPSA